MKLEALETYLSCPLAYYWRYEVRDGEKGKEERAWRSVSVIPGRLVLNALRTHKAIKGQLPLRLLVKEIVKRWLQGEGFSDQEMEVILRYAEIRERILMPFREGRIRKSDGSVYKQPQWSKRYRNMMISAGATQLEKGILDMMQTLHLTPVSQQGFVYHLGEAVADAFYASEQISPPAPDVILGVMVPGEVEVDGGVVTFEADMLVQEGNKVVAWVLHVDPWREISKHWVGRMPRVLAAGLGRYQISPEGEEREADEVVFVDPLRGWTHRRRSLSLTRLGWLLLIAQRGIRAGVYTPRFLAVPPWECRQCPYHSRCFLGDTEADPLEHFIPGINRWGAEHWKEAQSGNN